MLKNDLHVHTIGSGHAYSTISEIFEYASKNSMDIIAITDHGPNMEGASHLGYLENMLRLPKKIDDVIFLKSCEANILNKDGDIDIPSDLQDKLDFVMVGIHKRTDYNHDNVETNTQAILNAIEKNRVKVIAHPYRPEFPVDIEKISKTCAEKGVALEINIESLKANKANNEFIFKIKKMIEEVESNNGRIIISSDAHYVLEVGDDTVLSELKLEIPEGILLATKGHLLEFLSR